MIKKISLGGLLLCYSAISYAQEQDSTSIQVLDEVVVTDTRFTIPRENSGKTVIKIGPEELLRYQGRSLPELINTKSGIEISGSRGRPGEILGVYVRGGRGKQVIVVIDGVRVSDPSSFSQEFDLRLLPISSIASVEIIKGASSTLYGTNAATAVINITTKEASRQKISGSFQSSVGTNQTTDDTHYRLNAFENNVRINGTLDKWQYALGFGHRFTEGLSSLNTGTNESDPFSSQKVDLKLGHKFSDRFRTELIASQTKFRVAYDEAFGMTDAPYTFESDQQRVGLNSLFDYSSGSLALNIAYARYQSEDFSSFPGTFEGFNVIGDFFNKYQFKRLRTIVGINYNLESTDFDQQQQFVFVDPYASLVYLGPKGFQLNLGSRLNLHSEYGSNFVYTVNPSYSLKNKSGYLKFMASYATAYITPSLTQLFGRFGANPDLLPETDRTIEAGIELSSEKKFRINALVFDREEKDFVFFDNSTFQYGNAEGTINAKGFEFELNWQPTNVISLEANYTFTERKGDNAIRIPRHKAFGSIGYNPSKSMYLTVNYSYTGKRNDTDFTTFTEVPLDAFGLLGLYISYEIMPDKLMFFLNAENLLNKEYTEVLGFNTKGRNVIGGFTLTL